MSFKKAVIELKATASGADADVKLQIRIGVNRRPSAMLILREAAAVRLGVSGSETRDVLVMFGEDEDEGRIRVTTVHEPGEANTVSRPRKFGKSGRGKTVYYIPLGYQESLPREKMSPVSCEYTQPEQGTLDIELPRIRRAPQRSEIVSPGSVRESALAESKRKEMLRKLGGATGA